MFSAPRFLQKPVQIIIVVQPAPSKARCCKTNPFASYDGCTITRLPTQRRGVPKGTRDNPKLLSMNSAVFLKEEPYFLKQKGANSAAFNRATAGPRRGRMILNASPGMLQRLYCHNITNRASHRGYQQNQQTPMKAEQ